MPDSLNTLLLTNTGEAAQRLRDGQLVAFPTETVYGLGAHAVDVHAVAGVFEAKQRPAFDPLIVHVADLQGAEQVAGPLTDMAQRLADRFWPGALTLVLPRKSHIPDLVTAGLPGVGLRIPQHPVAQELLQQAGIPVAAPSANPFGQISPTLAEHVIHGLGGRIDAVLDGGPARIGLESTVVSLMQPEPRVLRLGGLPVEALEEVIGPVQVATPNPSADDAAQPAPGMLSRHYAPRTRLQLREVVPVCPRPRAALLTWGEPCEHDLDYYAVDNLSTAGDLRECAANFFAALRSLDAKNPDVIIARSFPERDLGRALNDRLRRASGRTDAPPPGE